MKKKKQPSLLLLALGIIVLAFVWFCVWQLFKAYRPSNVKPITLDNQMAQSTTADEDVLRQIFADKYKMGLDEVRVSIARQINEYASGAVWLGKDAPEGGGWLAVKKDGSWKVLYDGNGQIDCAIFSGYNFPVEIIQECASRDGKMTEFSVAKNGLFAPLVGSQTVLRVYPDVKTVDKLNKTMYFNTDIENQRYLVKFKETTKIYSLPNILDPSGNKSLTFDELIKLLTNWVGPKKFFTVKGIWTNTSQVTADEFYYVIQ